MYSKHKSSQPWLSCKDGFLGCILCAAVKNTPTMARAMENQLERLKLKETVRIAPQWANFEITYSGSDREAQLTSLRKRLHDQEKTKAREVAGEINRLASQNTLPNALKKGCSRALATTARCFRTVYKMAKTGKPFTDYPDSVELKELNGVDMGRVLHSNVVAKDIASFISRQLKTTTLKQLLESDGYFSVLLDEPTSLSVKSTVIIYIRYAFSADAEPVTMLLDLVELESKTAQSIYDVLISVLSKHGLTAEVLARRWLCLTTDGCSTMLGKKGRVTYLGQI